MGNILQELEKARRRERATNRRLDGLGLDTPPGVQGPTTLSGRKDLN